MNTNNVMYTMLARQRSTYKCCVCQNNLCFICDDVELDDMAITVPVDDFRVFVWKETEQRKKNICMKETEF